MFESCDSTPILAENLHVAAVFYANQGFSVIPVRGARDGEHPKRAAIPWKPYKSRLARTEELDRWFGDGRAGGLAIVCGRVSRLVVLDFDDAGMASEFRRQHPDLARTFTVRSGGRGLPHLYFRLPAGRLVPSQRAPGLDLRGEGSYVVAAPTRCGERAWMVERDAPVLELAECDLAAILAFVAALGPDPATTGASGHPDAIVAHHRDAGGPGAGLFADVTAEDLIARYRELAPMGRNQALFRMAVWARDAGWQEAAVAAVLAPVHARQPGRTEEPFSARLVEAVRTTASAFSRPRRSPVSQTDGPVSRLSNALREALMKHGLSAAARLLDALVLAGLQAGEWFSEKRACELVAVFGMGRRTVMRALKSMLQDGQQLFGQFTPRTPRKTADAARTSNPVQNSCFMSTGAERVKTGRPPRLYALPAAEELATRLGVKLTGGDPISPADLEHPARYRLALHRALLSRRPGQYPRRWLAGRLGISIWTTRRYERQADIQAQPIYASQPLRFANVRAYLPAAKDEAPRGVMLECEGRRYPALRPIALRLLAAGKAVFWKRREPNYYCPAGQAALIAPPVEVALPLVRAQAAAARAGVGIPTLPQLAPTGGPGRSMARQIEGCQCHPLADGAAGASWIQTVRAPAADVCEVLTPAADREGAAGDRLIQQARDRAPGLSARTVRGLIHRHGVEALQRALAALGSRRGIRNPAGFVVAFVRSEDNILLCNNRKAPARRQHPAADGAGHDWLRRMAASAYVDFLDNADDIRRLMPVNGS